MGDQKQATQLTIDEEILDEIEVTANDGLPPRPISSTDIWYL